MKIINLTDHTVNLFEADGKKVKKIFPTSGKIARVVSDVQRLGQGLVRYVPQSVFELPDETEWTFYIVSNPVRSALPNRKDLCSPNASVKDENGANVGCRSLILNP